MSLQVIPASQRLTFDVLWHLFGHVSLSDPLKGPMSISHISHQWRLVALSSPFIWSNITIRLYTSSQQHFLASAYFTRSRDVPITLTIHATRRFNSWEKTELLQPHAHRIRSLHVKASEGSLANLLWMEMDMPMPRLEAFDTVISNTSRISTNRKIVTIDDSENANIIPPVSFDSLVCWDLWNPTGLTTLTLDTTCLWNKPDLEDIYHLLATICNTIQHFEYKGLIACIDNAEMSIRSHLEFPELRSLAVLCHDNMVPLLQLMIIPALDSLTLRDFIVYPSTVPTATELVEMDELTINLALDQDGLFQVIKRWTTITHLEIYGIDDLSSDDLSSSRPELLAYIESLNQLSYLILYGIGFATSFAYTLFSRDDQAGQPLLPKLSCFVLAVVQMSTNNDLSHYLIARQRHHLPLLQKLSINSEYVQHLYDLNRIDILWESSKKVFVIDDPRVGKFIAIEEVNLLERLPLHE